MHRLPPPHRNSATDGPATDSVEKPKKLVPQTDRVPNQDEIVQLRTQHYNAEVVERLEVHEDLARFRIRPDQGVPPFDPGQYVALGLGYWEARLPGTQAEEYEPKQSWKVVRRAYSISCPMLDPQQNLLPCSRCEYLEFYITLIRQADTPPALTPRLFHLHAGQRLFVQPRVVGTYTLAGIAPEDDVVLLGTGTGEAPHNAMAIKLLDDGHRGRVVVATCARVLADFGYRKEHDVLRQKYENYVYLAYTTREPRNLNSTAADYVGLERLQTVYKSGRLAKDADIDLNPNSTHMFLCGNPAMIGLRRPQDPPLDQPGMLQLLIENGFRSLHPIPSATNSDSTDTSIADSGGAENKAANGSLAKVEMQPKTAQVAGPGVVRYEKYW